MQKKWKPEIGEEYHYVLVPHSSDFTGITVKSLKYESTMNTYGSNVFQTKEEAQKYVEIIKLLFEI